MMILMRFCGDVVATGVIEVALAGAKISCRPRLRLPYAEIGFGKHDSASPIKLNNVPVTISQLSASRPTSTSTSFMPAGTYNNESTMNHEKEDLGRQRWCGSQPTNLVFKTTFWAHQSHIAPD